MTTFLISFVPLVIAVVLHEVAHGWVAYKLGDPTAKHLGRLSLNPIVHVDPVLTLLLPGMLILAGSPFIFGGAKPVPVNPRNFRNPKKDMMLVALAGPVTNILLAFISAFLLSIQGINFDVNSWYFVYGIQSLPLITQCLFVSVIINLALAVFNLLPIPPLDGGRIAVGLLPHEYAYKLAKLEPYGFLIVVLLLSTGLLDYFFMPIFSFFVEVIFAVF